LIELPPRPFVLGRDPNSDLVVTDAGTSRRHASITWQNGRFVIADLGSTNGTFVNNLPIREKALAAGDFIRVGGHVMKFLSSDHIETQYHEVIYSLMITDGMTGVHNQRYLLEALEKELARSSRHRRPLAVCLIDIDNFKQVNDSYGHLAGDDVLREFCDRVRTLVRRDEVFARYGGEEFVVVLDEATREEACQFAERLRQKVADAPFAVDAEAIPVTVSIGIAHTDGRHPVTAAQMIARADEKMYEAKRTGRNRVVCASS
jgi:diguanylate cyclase (GGDEF)-like protein